MPTVTVPTNPAPGPAATHAQLPATFELKAAGVLSPPAISAPSGVPVALTVISSDAKAHQVVLKSPHPYRLAVPAHGRASAKVSGLHNGHYAIIVDGGKRGSLIIGAQPGP